MSLPTKQVCIVGGGLSGLACAIELQKAGMAVTVLEGGDAPGGRVRTDEVNGYLLDRGFQVFLDAYPEAGTLLDKASLGLSSFKPGALIFQNGRLHRVMDVFREPTHLFSSLWAPVGSLADKLRVALLKWRIGRTSLPEIYQREDVSTEQFLRSTGFSANMLQTFFCSFYGGIFLERELRTSSRMFEFTFKMFSAGNATLPKNGMGAISRQLASRLEEGTLRLGARVSEVRADGVSLESGERIASDVVVVATDATSASRLVPAAGEPSPAWRAVTCLYFTADRSPLKEAIIALNGSDKGLVNNVCVPSDVSPSYAPAGKSLISISVLGMPKQEGLEQAVLKEMEAWFGAQVKEWVHLRTDSIEKALPEQPPQTGMTGPGYRQHGSVFVCGDHLWSASIEGAIVSGKRCAKAILKG